MSPAPVRYTSADEDSGRWVGFPFRDGDIVISTRSKSGTTWMQMICALLVFKTPRLPQPLAELSPWLDWLTAPRHDVFATLDAQRHRRFIKTHTPLDGVPLDPKARYIVVARHPLDVAVSMYHHQANLDRGRLNELTGAPAHDGPQPSRPPLREWLLDWIDDQTPPEVELDLMPGIAHHLLDAWRRRHEPNVVLVHYHDLMTDLDGQMRRLADRLGEVVPAPAWPALVDAATFAAMRQRAAELVPERFGVLRDAQAFFRSGRSGSAAEVLAPDDVRRYRSRMAGLVPPDLLTWLHRP